MSGNNKHIIHAYEFYETKTNLDKVPVECVYFSREMINIVHHVLKKDKNQDFKSHTELVNSSCSGFFISVCSVSSLSYS